MPSLREKKRYLVFEIISSKKFNKFSVWKCIKEKLRSYLGSLGSSKAGLIFLEDKYDNKKNKGIIRVNHKFVSQVNASFSMITNIDKNPVIIRILGISGILKKAENKFY